MVAISHLVNQIWWKTAEKCILPPQRSYHIVFVVITVHFPERPPASCDHAVLRCVCLSFMTQELSLLFNQTAISQQEDVRGQSQLLQCVRSPKCILSDFQIRTKKPEMNRRYLALLAWERCGVEGYLDLGVLWQLLSVVHISVWRKGKKPVLGRFRGPA